MKKMLIAAAAVALAATVNAASFQWKVGTLAICDAGTSTATSATTVYLFNASDYAQTALITAVTSGSFDSSKAITSATLSSGKLNSYQEISSSVGTYGDTISTYFAVVVDNDVFVSATNETVVMADPDVTMLMFTGYASATKAAAIEFADASSYTGAGWYTAVPEPTSGLLLLLGMAGLALKRKHA